MLHFIQPTPTPYDPRAWARKPLPQRSREVCAAWALDGVGAPLSTYLFYALKLVLYVAGWVFFCRFSPGLGRLSTLGQWWLAAGAFQKAIVWSMLFEGLGFGCGSGPLSGRYLPPLGGLLYFLRPGTIRLPAWPRLPGCAGSSRTGLDVALYLGWLTALLMALVSATPGRGLLACVLGLTVSLGLRDRTVFLASRAEHYGTTLLCCVLAPDWLAGAKAVQLALWFWAGFSKLNHHFPAVVCVMASNSPLWPRRLCARLYRHVPDDLRPSALAQSMAHAGTALELGVALCLLLAPQGPLLVLGMAMMLMLHAFITSNVPVGVPLEWNLMVVYGGFALFWAHPSVSAFELGSPLLGALLLGALIAVPLLGNLRPAHVSFLLSMRYYAGNWPCSAWLFRGDSHRKLERLTKSSPWIVDQLTRMVGPTAALGLSSKVMGFRLLHLHGRAFSVLIPRAVPRGEDYQYSDGELIAGLALGWNFGDGHLHREELLRAIQARCEFEPGELRCVFVESQALGRATLPYRICDAHDGLLTQGELSIAQLRTWQPWGSETPESLA